MSSIPLPPNDAGLQSLRIDNQAQLTATQVSGVAPGRGVVETAHLPMQSARGSTERRHDGRRKTDRRQHQQPLVLDTRSNRDRRTHHSQRNDDQQSPDTLDSVRGIETTI